MQLVRFVCWTRSSATCIVSTLFEFPSSSQRAQGVSFRISKYEAVSCVVDMWSNWASPTAISRAQRICGFHKGSWSIDSIPTENFLAGDKMNADAAEFAHACASPSVANWLAIIGISPEGRRIFSHAHLLRIGWTPLLP